VTRYFDTSFLAPLILQEATSAMVEEFVRALPPDQLAISHWTLVEFSSLLAREVRMGRLSAAAAAAADFEFESVTTESFVVLAPNPSDFALARRYLRTYDSGLRAGDALHLAIAKNNGAETVYSFDNVMANAGTLLGIAVSRGPAG